MLTGELERGTPLPEAIDKIAKARSLRSLEPG